MNINKVLNSIKKNNILKLLFVVIFMCLLFYIINYNNLIEKDPVEMFSEKMDEDEMDEGKMDKGEIFNTSKYNELQANIQNLEKEIQDFKEERTRYEEQAEQRRKSENDEYEKDKKNMEDKTEAQRLAKLNDAQRLEELLRKSKEKLKEMVEQKKLEEQKRLEQKKLEEQKRLEQKKLEEQKRLEQQKIEEQKKLEEQKLEEKQKKLAEEQRLKQVENDRLIKIMTDKGYSSTIGKYPIKDTSLNCMTPTGNTQEEINNECINACKTNGECRRVWIYDIKSQKRCCLKKGELGELDESDESDDYRKNQPGIYWDLNKKVKFVEPNCNVGRPDETECNKRYTKYNGENIECIYSSRGSCDLWDANAGQTESDKKKCADTNNCLILK